MRYWLDTEFIEDGKTIDLISIGIVGEDGREYYAINGECDFSRASVWVKENVLLQIGHFEGHYLSYHRHAEKFVMGKKQIASDILHLVKNYENLDFRFPDYEQQEYDRLHQLKIVDKPEFWGYYADYDHVVFCQLFGTMMDLPKSFPMYCRDIKQWCDELGNPRLPNAGKGIHNALADAKWNKQAWEFLNVKRVSP